MYLFIHIYLFQLAMYLFIKQIQRESYANERPRNRGIRKKKINGYVVELLCKTRKLPSAYYSVYEYSKLTWTDFTVYLRIGILTVS